MNNRFNWKLPKAFVYLAVLCAFTVLVWPKEREIQTPDRASDSDGYDYGYDELEKNVNMDNLKFTRNTGAIDYSGISFSPWDVEAAQAGVDERPVKPYTIMIYMNGSDLESENGAATQDLMEMLSSGLKPENANLVIFTGGTNRWQNDVVPENECALWEIKDGLIYEISRIGLLNMGNAGTLASFIDFGVKSFPAEKYGLILWDHGGGSIAGYGHDEKFDNDNLSLLDMNYAFEKSAVSDIKLEFLGFDSCLMASVEMAVIASDYAEYMVASEDLTPGDGWDYSFLSAINKNPQMDGAELGAAITDYFMDYYGPYSYEDLNMSVIDLSNINSVMSAMGSLMQKCSDNIERDRLAAFSALSKRRGGTRTFGIGSPRDNESDMVDIGHMAYKLSDLFPNEAGAVYEALSEAVIYNRHNSDINLYGLSTFYIYGGRDTANASLGTYRGLNMDLRYTNYLYNFSNILLSGNIFAQNRTSRSAGETGGNHVTDGENLIQSDLAIWRPVDGEPGYFIMEGIKNNVGINSFESVNTLWPAVGGKHVCIYKISESNGHSLYAIPSQINGNDCDIIVLLSEDYPHGKILGARKEDGFIIQKGYDEINEGDKISFYYLKKYFGDNINEDTPEWTKGEEFTAGQSLKLDWNKPENDKYCYGFRLICIQNEEHFTELRPLR